MAKANPGPPPAEMACTKCGVVRPFDDFPVDRQRKWGRQRQCRPCVNARRQARPRVPLTEAEKKANRRAWWLKYRKGISVEQFDALMDAQSGVCAVCGAPPPEGTHLHVDHDHACCSDKLRRACGSCVRGLLCQHCNQGMGQFRDDPARLRAAAAYLEGR